MTVTTAMSKLHPTITQSLDENDPQLLDKIENMSAHLAGTSFTTQRFFGRRFTLYTDQKQAELEKHRFPLWTND